LLNAIRPVFLICMHDDFSVGFCAESVAARSQSIAQTLIVVNLAVENDPDRAVLIGKRLSAAAEVDDTEPSMPKTSGALRINSESVRSAMADDGGHSLDDRALDSPLFVKKKLSANAAHWVLNRV